MMMRMLVCTALLATTTLAAQHGILRFHWGYTQDGYDTPIYADGPRDESFARRMHAVPKPKKSVSFLSNKALGDKPVSHEYAASKGKQEREQWRYNTNKELKRLLRADARAEKKGEICYDNLFKRKALESAGDVVLKVGDYVEICGLLDKKVSKKCTLSNPERFTREYTHLNGSRGRIVAEVNNVWKVKISDFKDPTSPKKKCDPTDFHGDFWFYGKNLTLIKERAVRSGKFQKGSKVTIQGLKSYKELNGQQATLEGFDERCGAWTAILTKTGKKGAFFEKNMVLADSASSRVIKKRNVRKLQKGSKVTLHGLKKAERFNGQEATIEYFNDAIGAWTVRTQTGEMGAFFEKNIVLSDSA